MAVGLAVHAFLRLYFGAGAIFDGGALFRDGDLARKTFALQLQSGKNAGGAGSDDEYVVFHDFPPVDFKTRYILHESARFVNPFSTNCTNAP